uniref:Uncharacterized protein n=1 Tax=Catagonus wagneri TaxID=51154 RepID=A0A8C3WRM7_9CETA
MLAKLIVFFLDLTLALAVFVTLYAVYLIAATSIFISVVVCIFKGKMDKSYDFKKGRVWILDSSDAIGKPFAGNRERNSSAASCPVSIPKGRVFWSKESNSLF